MLVKVHATTVNRSDCGSRRRPAVLHAVLHGTPAAEVPHAGMELAGEVVAVGDGVNEFAVGDEVFGLAVPARTPSTCASASRRTRTQAHQRDVRGGRFRERRRLHRARLPASRQAARRVANLIYGASGSIGTAAVQLAKSFGAHVTAVSDTGTSTSSGPSVPTRSSTTRRRTSRRTGETYDVVFDASASTRSGEAAAW